MHLIKDVRKKFMSKQGGLIFVYTLWLICLFFFFFPWLHSQQQGAIRASKSSTNYLYISILLSHLRLTKLFWCFAFPFWVPVFNSTPLSTKSRKKPTREDRRVVEGLDDITLLQTPYHFILCCFLFFCSLSFCCCCCCCLFLISLSRKGFLV